MVSLGMLARRSWQSPFTGCLPTSNEPLPTGNGGNGNAPGSGSAGTGFVEPPATAGSGGTAPGRGGAAGTSSAGRGGAGGTMGISCSAGSTGTGGTATMGRGMLFPPNPGAMVTQASAPPAVSGGTLRVLSDGQTAVAADPDRDRVYVVDLTARAVSATVPLEAGDEPGRVIEDAAGRVHVALRRGGAVVTLRPRASRS